MSSPTVNSENKFGSSVLNTSETFKMCFGDAESYNSLDPRVSLYSN